MNAKTLFAQNKDLCAWWSEIANSTKFDMVLLHASAIALESCPSEQQREGAMFIKEVLLNLSSPDDVAPEFPKPGLDHDFEPKRKTIE